MRNKFLILSFFVFTNFCAAQTYSLENRDQITSNWPDNDSQPDFPGGIQNLNKIIKSEIGSRKNSGETITFEFAVNSAGKTIAVKTHGEKKYFSNKKLKKLLKSLPNWLPAIKDSKSIECVVTATIKF